MGEGGLGSQVVAHPEFLQPDEVQFFTEFFAMANLRGRIHETRCRSDMVAHPGESPNEGFHRGFWLFSFKQPVALLEESGGDFSGDPGPEIRHQGMTWILVFQGCQQDLGVVGAPCPDFFTATSHQGHETSLGNPFPDFGGIFPLPESLRPDLDGLGIISYPKEGVPLRKGRNGTSGQQEKEWEKPHDGSILTPPPAGFLQSKVALDPSPGPGGQVGMRSIARKPRLPKKSKGQAAAIQGSKVPRVPRSWNRN